MTLPKQFALSIVCMFLCNAYKMHQLILPLSQVKKLSVQKSDLADDKIRNCTKMRQFSSNSCREHKKYSQLYRNLETEFHYALYTCTCAVLSKCTGWFCHGHKLCAYKVYEMDTSLWSALWVGTIDLASLGPETQSAWGKANAGNTGVGLSFILFENKT